MTMSAYIKKGETNDRGMYGKNGNGQTSISNEDVNNASK